MEAFSRRLGEADKYQQCHDQRRKDPNAQQVPRSSVVPGLSIVEQAATRQRASNDALANNGSTTFTAPAIPAVDSRIGCGRRPALRATNRDVRSPMPRSGHCGEHRREPFPAARTFVESADGWSSNSTAMPTPARSAAAMSLCPPACRIPSHVQAWLRSAKCLVRGDSRARLGAWRRYAPLGDVARG